MDRIEALIHEEVGRNIDGLFAAAKAVCGTPRPHWRQRTQPSVGIITGFYVPLGTPPAAETDGPVGAAMLAARADPAGRLLPPRHR